MNKIIEKHRTMRDTMRDAIQLLSNFKGNSIGENLLTIKNKKEEWKILLVLWVDVVKMTQKFPILTRYVAKLQGILQTVHQAEGEETHHRGMSIL